MAALNRLVWFYRAPRTYGRRVYVRVLLAVYLTALVGLVVLWLDRDGALIFWLN